MATAKTTGPVKIRGFYTCEQAADWLDMKPDTVRRYVHRGLIQAGVLGGIYLIAESELKRFQRERRGPGNPTFSKQSA
jgi:excisionase family DNA binding protein